MAGLFSQLSGGNPFNTQVGQRIEQATDGSLASENWALNIEICDLVNETPEGPKDALRAIRKRLTQNAGKNYTVVMYSLTVLEACVINNKDKRFQYLVTQKDFVQDLIRLIGPKNDPPTAVQEKVLSLIQSWAEAFRSDPEMQGVVQIYTDLKQKGIEFPNIETDIRAPIHTPSRTVPSQPESQEVPTQESPEPIGIHPNQLEKLRKELDVVQGNMKVFSEMLTELTPGKEHQSDLELLWELCKTCQHMQGRIVELLDKVGNEKITEDLLQVNDELNNLFLRYERFEKKRAAVKQESVVKEVEEPKPLIDLEDNSSDILSKQLENLDLNTTSTGIKLDDVLESGADEFDMLAQSRTLEIRKKVPVASEIKSDQTTPDGIKPQDVQIQREQDFHEMERWLQDQPEMLEEGALSATAAAAAANPAFESFLAARAAAAEQLPTINTPSPNVASPSEKEASEKKSLSPMTS